MGDCTNEYLGNYFQQLPKIRIIALDEVEEHLEAGELERARLETIPESLEEMSK